MKRRDFLKLVGSSVVAPSVLVAKKQKELKPEEIEELKKACDKLFGLIKEDGAMLINPEVFTKQHWTDKQLDEICKYIDFYKPSSNLEIIFVSEEMYINLHHSCAFKSPVPELTYCYIENGIYIGWEFYGIPIFISPFLPAKACELHAIIVVYKDKKFFMKYSKTNGVRIRNPFNGN